MTGGGRDDINSACSNYDVARSEMLDEFVILDDCYMVAFVLLFRSGAEGGLVREIDAKAF